MNFSFIRYILISFLIVVVLFSLASMVALASLERIAAQLGSAETEQILGLVRTGQRIILPLGLGGLLFGLVGMAFSVQQAARIVDRIRRAARQLGDAVPDETAPAELFAAGDSLDREIQSMMHKIKESQRRYLDASPLTRLPGNLAIEEVLKGKMERGEKFALCYVDLDDFKAFNDKYGYARGSDIIKMSGEVIYRAKDQHADKHDFVGHIGGDDFVLITSPDQAEQVCRSIITDFDRSISAYYDAEDRDRGYIEGRDRYGVTRRFPIMSISIAVVSDVRRSFATPVEIAKVATEIKDYVKALPGSNYLVDRRLAGRPYD